jgi:hypothetical protein
VTLREEHKLRLFENRVLRRIFGPKGDEVTGGCTKLHEELHNLYCSLSTVRIIEPRKMRWAWHVAPMGEKCIWNIGGKAGRKETSRKTKT